MTSPPPEQQAAAQTAMDPVCDWSRNPDPCTVCIFGASGDLTTRKLIPALYRLFSQGCLAPSFSVLGAARSDLGDEGFRRQMRQSLADGGAEMSHWDEFARRLHYQRLEYDSAESYQALAGRLAQLDSQFNAGGNRLLSLAIPPGLYATVARGLAASGLAGQQRGRWTRLVVEKPFGYDLQSAKELDRAIGQGFAESQVFRIDHYMTKRTVQNILVLRFANTIFEPLWNRNYIEYVRINAAESLGVEHRAGYFEKAGVLRDMFQNHMMELMALVAMEPLSVVTADLLRDKKAELFRSLRPLDINHLGDHLVLGQYHGGEIDGRPVGPYRQEPGVDPESTVPTYALMKCFVDNWRWQGVPFYLSSGKRLRRKVTRVDIQFKPVPHSMFRNVVEGVISSNRLVFGIYPEENIFLNFQALGGAGQFNLRQAGLSFSFHEGQEPAGLGAYEIAFGDVMSGDQTLFWRQDGLELCWAYLDPVLRLYESLASRSELLHPYRAGSHGPGAAMDMLPAGCWPEKL